MAFGNAAAERRALEATFEDTAIIRRMEPQCVGAVDRAAPTDVYAGVPCALSRRADASRQTSAQQDVEYDCVLFAAPELEVLPGDAVEVARLGRVYAFEAVGRPAVYATHQEIFLKGRELA